MRAVSDLSMRLLIVSKGIRSIPALSEFLGPDYEISLDRRPDCWDGVLVWGKRPSARAGEALAHRFGRPVVRVEDAFLRSIRPGVQGAHPLGLVVDDVGIYYDATAASQLERLVASKSHQVSDFGRARAVIAQLRHHRLSKYNFSADRRDLLQELGLPRVGKVILVVDQRAGDQSIAGAMGGPASFRAMVSAALDENPGATVIVKSHPDQQTRPDSYTGAIGSIGSSDRIQVVREPVNPWALLDLADKVYTVSSLLGFEALLAGKQVVCFGSPFFAGWGLTDDRGTPLSRRIPVPLEGLFEAAYIQYARYLDPYDGKRCEIEKVIEILAFLRDRYLERSRTVVCVGFRTWKRKSVEHFLAQCTDRVRFVRSSRRAIALAAANRSEVLVWAAHEPQGLDAAAAGAGVPLVRVEDGFIRSVGLGANRVSACSLVFDRQGIYYRPDRPSDIEGVLGTFKFDDRVLDRAKELISRIRKERISKYNLSASTAAPKRNQAGEMILVPGQVESDRSILYGAENIRTNLHLLAAVRARHPHGCIVYRPHPDVTQGHRRGYVSRSVALRFADCVAEDGSIVSLVESADIVETITSLAGFDALLRGKRVITHGRPFYAGWGLTEDIQTIARPRKLTLAELVAGVLLAYPRYYDPVSGLPCEAERLLDRIRDRRTGDFEMLTPWIFRLHSKWDAAARKLIRKVIGDAHFRR